MHLRVRG
jgi:hypothetical protein